MKILKLKNRRELNVWCFQYKSIQDKIETQKLEELSQWDDGTDKVLKDEKLFIDKMTKRFAEENQYINEYLTSISLAELTDAYIKSKTNKFEPGEQKDIGTIISHMLHKVIKNQNLEEEKD